MLVLMLWHSHLQINYYTRKLIAKPLEGVIFRQLIWTNQGACTATGPYGTSMLVLDVFSSDLKTKKNLEFHRPCDPRHWRKPRGIWNDFQPNPWNPRKMAPTRLRTQEGKIPDVQELWHFQQSLVLSTSFEWCGLGLPWATISFELHFKEGTIP